MYFIVEADFCEDITGPQDRVCCLINGMRNTDHRILGVQGDIIMLIYFEFESSLYRCELYEVCDLNTLSSIVGKHRMSLSYKRT